MHDINARHMNERKFLKKKKKEKQKLCCHKIWSKLLVVHKTDWNGDKIVSLEMSHKKKI